jgi:hypothetical protein
MTRIILALALLTVGGFVFVGSMVADDPARGQQKAELADNSKNQEKAEPIVEAIKALGFKPDPADTNRIGGAMTFTVNRDVLTAVAEKLNGKTISVGFDGKVTIQ